MGTSGEESASGESSLLERGRHRDMSAILAEKLRSFATAALPHPVRIWTGHSAQSQLVLNTRMNHWTAFDEGVVMRVAVSHLDLDINHRTVECASTIVRTMTYQVRI
jgi:hypothetical protein